MFIDCSQCLCKWFIRLNHFTIVVVSSVSQLVLYWHMADCITFTVWTGFWTLVLNFCFIVVRITKYGKMGRTNVLMLVLKSECATHSWSHSGEIWRISPKSDYFLDVQLTGKERERVWAEIVWRRIIYGRIEAKEPQGGKLAINKSVSHRQDTIKLYRFLEVVEIQLWIPLRLFAIIY